MSLHAFRDLMHDLERPTQLLDQHFGMGLHPEDLLAPLTIPHLHGRHNYHVQPYQRPWRTHRHQDQGSVVKFDKNKFQVNLDVQQFAPHEITVKTVDRTIIVEGHHEEKQDEHGFISRRFVRKYVLPDDHDVDHVASHLSSDGVLTITAPKINAEETGEKLIPIRHTGIPHKAVKSAPTEVVGKDEGDENKVA